jgi:hypothetical protein
MTKRCRSLLLNGSDGLDQIVGHQQGRDQPRPSFVQQWRMHMARRSLPTELSATRGNYSRGVADSKNLSATHLDILDTLAFVRPDQDNPREG